MFGSKTLRRLQKVDLSTNQQPGAELSCPQLENDSSSSSTAQRKPGSTYIIPIKVPRAESQEKCDSRCWLRQVYCLPDTDALADMIPEQSVPFDSDADLRSLIYQSILPWQTRLLALHPSATSEALSCTLVTVDIIDEDGMGIAGSMDYVIYEALSYCWGMGPKTYHLQCDGHPIAISETLAKAITVLRSTTDTKYLWCDTVCINQADLKEKAMQVRNIFRIFEKASRVIGWLDVPHAQADRLIKGLELAWDPDEVRLWYWKEHSEDCERAAVAIRHASNQVLSQPWFLRTWVRQEIYAARDLVLQVGRHQVAFQWYLDRLEHLHNVLAFVGAVNPPIKPPTTLKTLQREYQHRGSDHKNFYMLGFHMPGKIQTYTAYWLQTLTDGARFQVTEPKDRVYAALGILANRTVRLIAQTPLNIESLVRSFPVDYLKSTADIYQDATKFLINTTQSLEVLDYFRSVQPVLPGSTPNWSRDWAQEESHIGYHHHNLRYGALNYIKPLEQDYACSGKLRLEGVQVLKQLVMLDRIKEISHPRDRFNPRYRRSTTLQDLSRESRRRVSANRIALAARVHHPPHAYVFSSLAETMSTYEMINDVVLPLDLEADFASYLAGDNFVFGYGEDMDNESSLGLENLHLLLPRATHIDDMIISLYGSSCLHVVRPMQENISEESGVIVCRYLSPVVAVVCGQDYIDEYSTKSSRSGLRTFAKNRSEGNPNIGSGSHNWRKTFVLI